MASVRGHYEWDDDDLTPGRSRQGGLHQNLFDSKGNLKGSARFVPDEGHEPDTVIVTETVYVPVAQRRKSREQDRICTDSAGSLSDSRRSTRS